MREVRVRIDCIIRVPGETLPAVMRPLDVIEKGVRELGATEILPGGRVLVNFTRKESIAVRAKANRKL